MAVTLSERIVLGKPTEFDLKCACTYIENKVGITLYDYQVNLIKSFMTCDRLFIIKGRQVGMTTLLAGYNMWLHYYCGLRYGIYMGSSNMNTIAFEKMEAKIAGVRFLDGYQQDYAFRIYDEFNFRRKVNRTEEETEEIVNVCEFNAGNDFRNIIKFIDKEIGVYKFKYKIIYVGSLDSGRNIEEARWFAIKNGFEVKICPSRKELIDKIYTLDGDSINISREHLCKYDDVPDSVI